MTEFFGLLLMAVVIEACVDIIKDIFVNKQVVWQKVVAIVLAEIVAIGFSLDLFTLLGLTSTVPYLSMVLTGLLMSRGSNYLADLLKKIQSFKNQDSEQLG